MATYTHKRNWESAYTSIIGTSTGSYALSAGTEKTSTAYIDLSEYFGAHVVCDTSFSSTAAAPDGVTYKFYAGLTTANFDDSPFFSQDVSTTPDPNQLSVDVSGFRYIRVGVVQDSSDDSHSTWVYYSRYRVQTT